jgi:hypothetical protein
MATRDQKKLKRNGPLLIYVTERSLWVWWPQIHVLDTPWYVRICYRPRPRSRNQHKHETAQTNKVPAVPEKGLVKVTSERQRNATTGNDE